MASSATTATPFPLGDLAVGSSVRLQRPLPGSRRRQQFPGHDLRDLRRPGGRPLFFPRPGAGNLEPCLGAGSTGSCELGSRDFSDSDAHLFPTVREPHRRGIIFANRLSSFVQLFVQLFVSCSVSFPKGYFISIMTAEHDIKPQQGQPGSAEGFWRDLRLPASLEKVTVAGAGGKAANLARLAELGLPTPRAVVLTTDAWFFFLDSTGLRPKLEEALAGLRNDPGATGEIDSTARKIAALINDAVMPEGLEKQIRDTYDDLSERGVKPLAIRSSGSYEDSPDASFSGMLSTVLGVAGVDGLFAAIRKCWASGFNPRGLRYLARMGLDPAGVAVALIFQQMVKARSSGVLFTVDPATGDAGTAVLEAAYGYGPGVVSGQVTPDLYRIDKKTLEIVHRDARPQEHYYGADGLRRDVLAENREETKLSDEQVRELVSYGITAERELAAPQDIEWCLSPDGIVLLQTRPVTGLEKLSLRQKNYERPEIVMVRGIGVSPRVGWGEVVIVWIRSRRCLHPSRGRSWCCGASPRTWRRISRTPPRWSPMRAAPPATAPISCASSRCRAWSASATARRCCMTVTSSRSTAGADWCSTASALASRSGSSVPSELLPTRTRLMTTINVPESAEKAAGIADGVISFRNDYLLLQGGVHPRLLLKSGKGETLTNVGARSADRWWRRLLRESRSGTRLWMRPRMSSGGCAGARTSRWSAIRCWAGAASGANWKIPACCEPSMRRCAGAC